ncbi:E3 SUMO-protein ligase RanBP2-like [Haliotis rufescens]|uniref:E3 SUMO-protein ligase RanBP2-like n=1 Tax=Haliotis rufescens TaxID=6454 RepID=UPI00201FA7AB|nr:E3 SUMO-protein ligase RanBP2-like [Haliotis rufescens]
MKILHVLHFIQSCLELCCPTEVLSLKKKIEAKIIAKSATILPQRIRQKSSITFSQTGLRPLTESMATFGETCTAYYTSGVDFLYVEEATEEQKARARKYLLPESFYLYENKPPCPGCIGCEDYDPSKVSVPSKVKAKSKSEETSPAPTIASVQVSSSAGNTSGVDFLYVEEATEEQKARARKYLLPESFYLYENKPPCPGCIGCEDYDPSKVSMPSKVRAKSKSEETSPAPTIASVQVSSSAGSVAGSTGASEGFCMIGQASGMSFSTLAAQGDAVGYAFKKDENRPFQWSGAGQQIFGTSPGGNRTNVDDDEVVQSDDIDFKPIIDLPELVEVKTGEEGWEVVYCQRSKLFPFVRDSNQWKERAVGDMKILKQDTESGISGIGIFHLD